MRQRRNGQFLQKSSKFNGDHGLFGPYAAIRVMGGLYTSLFPTFTFLIQVVQLVINFIFCLSKVKELLSLM